MHQINNFKQVDRYPQNSQMGGKKDRLKLKIWLTNVQNPSVCADFTLISRFEAVTNVNKVI